MEGDGSQLIAKVGLEHGRVSDRLAAIVGFPDQVVQTILVRSIHDDEVVTGVDPVGSKLRMFIEERESRVSSLCKLLTGSQILADGDVETIEFLVSKLGS